MPTAPRQPLSEAADTPPLNLAEIKGRFSASWDTTAKISEPPQLEQAPMPCPPGYVAWRVVGQTAVTVLPQLLPGAPVRVRRAYHARVLSTLVGRCPLCGQAASINADPETHPAGWSTLDITIGIVHLSQCSGTFLETDRKWFDPRAVPQ